MFGICAILMGFSVIYCVYYVEEIRRDSPTKENIAEETDTKKKPNLFMDWFNFKGLKCILTVLIRKREDKKRMMLYLCYLVLFFGMGPFFGEIKHYHLPLL